MTVARRDGAGRYVPPSRPDVARWSRRFRADRADDRRLLPAVLGAPAGQNQTEIPGSHRASNRHAAPAQASSAAVSRRPRSGSLNNARPRTTATTADMRRMAFT